MNREIDRVLDAIETGKVDENTFGVEFLKGLIPALVESEKDPFEKLKIARLIIETISEQDQRAIDNFLGIKMVEDGKKYEGLDCYGYVFGKKSAEDVMVDLFTNWNLSIEPQADSVALYLNDELDRPLHIGKVGDNLQVTSKWGLDGMIFEHQPYLVPLSYGWHIAYFTRKAT